MLSSLGGTSASLAPQLGPGASSPTPPHTGSSPARWDPVNKHSSFQHVSYTLIHFTEAEVKGSNSGIFFLYITLETVFSVKLLCKRYSNLCSNSAKFRMCKAMFFC